MLYGFIAVYLLAVLGLGLLISTFCDTQQQAMFICFFLFDDLYFDGRLVYFYRQYAWLGPIYSKIKSRKLYD